jgi:hypothetical protein
MANHDCSVTLIYDPERHDLACSKCGILVEDEGLKRQFYEEMIAMTADPNHHARDTAEDHNAGNALLGSETPNMDYKSKSNPGVAFLLNNPYGRDFAGKKTVPQLRNRNGYLVGNIAGKSGMSIKHDYLSGASKIKFDLYSKSMWEHCQSKAFQELSRLNLSAVEIAIIAKEIKHIISSLFFDSLTEYAYLAAALNARILKPKDEEILEQRLYDLMPAIRLKMLSRCNRELAKELEEPPTIQATPQSESPVTVKMGLP